MKQPPGGDYRNRDSGELVEKGNEGCYPPDKFGELTAMKKERAMTAIEKARNDIAKLDMPYKYWEKVRDILDIPISEERAKPSLPDDVEEWLRKYWTSLTFQANNELLAILDKHR